MTRYSPILRNLAPALCAALVSISLLTPSASAQTRTCAGIDLPTRIHVDGQPLVLNGMGIREATIFQVDVYVAGLYLPSRTRNGGEILQSLPMLQIVLKFVRDVDRETLEEAFQQGFERNAGSRLDALRDRIAQLRRWTPRPEEGDTIVFTHRPGQGVEMIYNRQRLGVLPGEDFARVFFSIWLGPEPPNRGLKSGLLGGECG